MNIQEDSDDWCLVGEEAVDALPADFLRSILIWFTKPHTVNRRLCGINVLHQQKHFLSSGSWREALTVIKSSYKELTDLLDESNIISEKVELTPTSSIDVQAWKDQFLLQVRKLLPRQLERTSPTFEIAVLDPTRNWALFEPVMKDENKRASTPPQTYVIRFEEDPCPRIQLWVKISKKEKDTAMENPSIQWLLKHLLPRLKKWSETNNETENVASLQLVPIDRYNELYQELKKKYAPKFIEIWPEKTDPLKFVFEDVAIATYLILLWEKERNKRKQNSKPSFVDLGCGNGLLVYILINEGHPGLGIDIRKRKIWDFYGPEVQDKLKVAPITPSSEFLFPEYDWLIGNHSDELTPWIPVMAARSSYNTNFFLLPCCSYDFNCKFQRIHSGLSQYQSYLEYITEVCTRCGFEVSEDKLRIPSTKRICLVGINKARNAEDMALKEQEISAFLSERCATMASFQKTTADSIDVTDTSSSSHQFSVNSFEKDNIDETVHWIPNFSARCAVEPVRNCTKLDEKLKETIVSQVVAALLKADPLFIHVESDSGNKLWNSGGKLSLPVLAEIIGKENLHKLKSEFGGLQTLLKNHYQIFQVSQSFVSLKNYSCAEVPRHKRKSRYTSVFNKVRPCWFDENHPDGCPVKAEACRYIHNCNAA